MVKIKYGEHDKSFILQDAVDCPEWIVPFHVFKEIAEEVNSMLLLFVSFIVLVIIKLELFI